MEREKKQISVKKLVCLAEANKTRLLPAIAEFASNGSSGDDVSYICLHYLPASIETAALEEWVSMHYRELS